jgi:hypothetical protein
MGCLARRWQGAGAFSRIGRYFFLSYFGPSMARLKKNAASFPMFLRVLAGAIALLKIF